MTIAKHADCSCSVIGDSSFASQIGTPFEQFVHPTGTRVRVREMLGEPLRLLSSATGTAFTTLCSSAT